MDVESLRVYQQAMEAFRMIEEISIELPHNLADVKRQVLRSSKAIAPLLAEGFGRRRSQKEFRRFVVEAMSSSDETITHLRTIATSRFNRTSIAKLDDAIEAYRSISRQLNKLSSVVTV